MVATSRSRSLRNRKSRGRGLRTTNGCLTCRKRHIKCDETKPICGPCNRKDERCHYALSSSRRPLTSGVTVENTPQPVHEQSPILEGHDRTRSSTPEQHEANALPLTDNGDYVPPESPSDQPSAIVPPAHQSPIDGYGNNYFSPPDISITPGSFPSPDPTITAAAVQWFRLLASDAARESSQLPAILHGFENECATLDRGGNEGLTQLTSLQYATQVLDLHTSHGMFDGNAEADSVSTADSPPEERLWQAQEPISLLPRETFLFENFIDRISQWIDLFDPLRQFSTLVPHLAIRNAGLMNAILALSCRHLSLNPRLENPEQQSNGKQAIQYYYQTLHYVQKAMQYPSYKTSLELLATTLIISTYEMFDSSSNDWERHLEGVFLIQRSQVIHGESGGLQAAVWWAWLCQDIWAAFRERRKTWTFWVPQKPLQSLSPCEIASRSVYIMAKVINFCAQMGRTSERSTHDMMAKAKYLHAMLDEWQKHLTIEFSPLPLGLDGDSSVFRPKYIRPPSFAVAVQLHLASKILLLSHEPSPGGLGSYWKRQNMIQQCVDTICGIAMTLNDDASSLMSSQALFIAGMFTSDTHSRKAILDLLDSCRQRTGWPVQPLGKELEQLWETHSAANASVWMSHA